MDRSLIEQYAAGGAALRQGVAGLRVDELTARPGPGAWSILELVVHLADSDLLFLERMRRILTEDDPPLPVADETVCIERLFPHEQSLDDAVTLLEVGRRQFARVLRRLPDAAFDRAGQHSVRGRVTLGDVVAGAVSHLAHHLEFLREKRARLGHPAS